MKKVKNLKKKIEAILVEKGYSISYQSHFSKEELKKYAAVEPNMKEVEYFTVTNNKKQVIARLTGVEKNDEIDAGNFEKLLNFFVIYDIPNSKEIAEELSKFE